MARFAAMLKYTDDQARITEIRPTHREYLKSLLESGKLDRSGPFIDGSGSIIVYLADDLAEAQVLLANDPFSKNGIIVGAKLKEWDMIMSRD